MIIRPEREEDIAAVWHINTAAFPTSAEANLVDRLRREAAPVVAWVAEEESASADPLVGHLIGCIMLSPMSIEIPSPPRLMGLAPVAVLPDRQAAGVGGALVEAGVEQCREMGVAAIFLLGHPDYYPRFGFRPATQFGIDSVYEVPPEYFMALELQEGALEQCSGTVHYHPAFADL